MHAPHTQAGTPGSSGSAAHNHSNGVIDEDHAEAGNVRRHTLPTIQGGLYTQMRPTRTGRWGMTLPKTTLAAAKSRFDSCTSLMSCT